MNAHHFLRGVLASALASTLILQTSVSYADDTEIFFGGSALDSGIRPNVLFILDDSGSMAYCVDSTNTCKNNSRMDVLKSTMDNLLNTTSGVNVGLMVLNNTAKTTGDTSVPRLLQPIADIDSPINVKLSSPEIRTSADDASRYNGSNNTADQTLVMGYIKAPIDNPITRSLGTENLYSNDNSTYYLRNDYTCSVKMDETDRCPDGQVTELNANQDALLLFRNLNLPQGMAISKATLELSPTTTVGNASFDVSLVSSKTPAAFNHSEKLNSKFTDSKNVQSIAGRQLDITELLRNQQKLEPRHDPIGDLAIHLKSRTSFKYEVGDVANAPKLIITYSTSGSEAEGRPTGLRFQTVNVPRGANITRATLNFVPASSNDRPVTFNIAAEASGNASDFSGADFSQRATTRSTTWTPEAWRTTSPPVPTQNGADVTGLVQAVVNRGDWCGNNAMAFIITPSSGDGSRTAISQDGSDGLKPTLSVSYTGGDEGCIKPIVDLNLIDAKDDARQYQSKGSGGIFGSKTNNIAVSVSENTMALTDQYTYIGARFQHVPLKKGAIVEEARLIVTPSSGNGTQATVDVYFENTDNSSAFTTRDDNLRLRDESSMSRCTFTSRGAGIPVICEATGLKNALQSVLNRNGWKDGNSLSVLLHSTGSSNLSLRAVETSKADAIRLQVKLSQASDLSDNTYKVRDYLKGISSDMNASGGTPLVNLLYQGASYYSALSGKHQGPESPIESSCQPNYMVLMTDGQANHDSTSIAKTVINNAQNLIGITCPQRDSADRNFGANGETCGVEIAKWLNTTDQSSNLDGKNLVTVHTVGFALQTDASAKQFLSDIATAGGGKSYTADNANELANAFDSIIQEALATDTSFVNSSAPVNSFNRADNLDQLYYALFRPSKTDRWEGNLKRYRLKTEGDTATIVDADDTPAIDKNTGFFKNNARSFWSGTRDGSDVAKGGAAEQLPAPGSRNLFTSIGDNLQSLAASNTNITKTMLGDARMSDSTRTQLLNYIRGYDPANNNAVRNALGDPIHSSPALVTYSCHTMADGQCIEPEVNAIMGTNEGFIHSFNARTGEEDFAFIPQELLGNIKQLQTNAVSMGSNRPYGMDNPVTLWANDSNNDGVINGNGEFVYAYATMGRGGNNIYALDITNKKNPKLLWQIKGGSKDFESLGQTWSAPAKTRIKVGSTIRDVLIFAGGYDPEQEAQSQNNSSSIYRADSQGNSIYIVDAKTGDKIWSAGNGSSYNANLRKMIYSIPSSVRVIDLDEGLRADPERLADQFFVGDMGGQIWRFFINNGSSGSALVTPGGSNGDGVFASIGGNTPANARRFYNEPDVALLNLNGTLTLTVNIGSGYRGHPLNEYITDRFYSFRTTALFKDNTQTTLRESDLYDATTDLDGSGNFDNANTGWYITLTNSGEKVLSSALTAGGNVYFNTYEPELSTAACSASVGVNRSYAVSLKNATPARYTTNLDGTITYGDRAETSNSGGIAGDPQLFCTGDNCWVIPDMSIPPMNAKTPPLGKTYWTDNQDLDANTGNTQPDAPEDN